MNKYLLLAVACMQLAPLAYGQTFDQTRMEKYWRYRDNFNKNFNVRSANIGEPGVNIPAVDVFMDNGQRMTIDFGDANVNLGHYFMLLATEYKVLKNSGQSYQNTLAELYTALLSFERLDEYSEAWVRYISNPVVTDHDKQYVRPNLELYANHQTDANGWIIRGDADRQYFINYQNRLGIENNFNPIYDPTTGELFNPNDGINSAISDFFRSTKLPENISQDMIINMLPGWALIKKVMVGPEYVGFCDVNHNSFIKSRLESQGILSGDYVDFDKWVDNIITRFIGQLKHPDPQPTMPMLHTDADPFSCATWNFDPCWEFTHKLPGWFHKHCPIEIEVPGCDIIETRWYLRFPSNVFSHRLNFLGNGDDFDLHFCFSNGICNASNKVVGSSTNFHGEGSDDLLQQNIFRAVYNSSTANEVFNLFSNSAAYPAVNDPAFAYLFEWLSGFLAATGGYKTRVMATVADFDNLVGYANAQIPYSDKEPCEQLPLLWYYLHGTSSLLYIKPQESIYTNLLAVAPCNGCRNYPDPKGFNAEWSSNSRFVNAHERTIFKPAERPTERSGMDFMIAHNLYALVYNKSLYHLETDAYQTATSQVNFPTDFVYSENGSVITSVANVSVPTEYVASKAIHLKPGFHAIAANYYKGKIGEAPSGTSQYSIYSSCVSVARLAFGTDYNLTEATDGEGVKEGKFVNQVLLYPNPSSGKFTVKSKVGNQAILYSSLGQRLLMLNEGGGNYEVDLGGEVAPGMYQIVFGDGQHITISIMP